MSISELEARIEGFSTEIERQKEVLNDLRRSKSHAQRQLNALRDPLVARIPVEISSEIFLHCLPSHPGPGIPQFPTFLLAICHAWSDIALSLPALWGGISIHLSEATQDLETTVSNWLKRARGHPLDVSLIGLMGETNQQVASLIWEHSEQLKSLEIDFVDVDLDAARFDYRKTVYRLLGDFRPEKPLPFLRTLLIRGQFDLQCSWLPIHRLLSFAPNLVELELGELSLEDVDSLGKRLVLPKLRRLELSRSGYFGTQWHSRILHSLHSHASSAEGLPRRLGRPRLGESLPRLGHVCPGLP